MVATPVATSAVPERRCPPAPATLQTSGRPPAYSATATACPRPRWRNYTPFIIYTQASPLRSPFPTSTDDGLKWKRTPTVASPAILDEGSSRFLVNREERFGKSMTRVHHGLSRKSLWRTLTSLTLPWQRLFKLGLTFKSLEECDLCASLENNLLK